ncbi:MAG: VOC family protein [Advenella sp.]|uniref:VOC family protein n=1 Tax=Advenella sp. TaxID=1872388 RepID=UPI003F97B0B5
MALKVNEIEKTGQFYQEVFGFQDVVTKKTRDHTSRHMTDGAIDFTLLQYDAGTTSAESKASGDGPCIHHFAVEVEDIDVATQEILSHGCEIVSDPGIIPVKFKAPGGTVAELVPLGRYKLSADGEKIDRIVHLALKVSDVEKTGDFYKKVFGFKDTETKRTRDHISRHMTDGFIDFTLLKYDSDTQSAESKAAGDGPCIHHFAVEVADLDKARDQIDRYGAKVVSDPGIIPVKFIAPGGTVAELVPLNRYRFD